jgi:hypothetical protein
MIAPLVRGCLMGADGVVPAGAIVRRRGGRCQDDVGFPAVLPPPEEEKNVRMRAEQMARQVKGVRDVVSNLRIESRVARPGGGGRQGRAALGRNRG